MSRTQRSNLTAGWRASVLGVVACSLLALVGAAQLAPGDRARLQQQIAACVGSGCVVQLEARVYALDGPLVIDHPMQLRGMGWGKASGGQRRTSCATTLAYTGDVPIQTLLTLKNGRGFGLHELCLDGRTKAHTLLSYQCEKGFANCGEADHYRVALFGGSPAPGAAFIRLPEQRYAFEHVRFTFLHTDQVRGDPLGPQYAVVQASQNTDHLEIDHAILKPAHATLPIIGVWNRAGNFTLRSSIVTAHGQPGSWSVKIEGRNDWYHIEGLILEPSGKLGGVLIEGDPDIIRSGSIISSELKVPYDTDALKVITGGALNLGGTSIGLHGGGDPRKPVRVSFQPSRQKRLHVCQSLRPSSFWVMQMGEHVIEHCK